MLAWKDFCRCGAEKRRDAKRCRKCWRENPYTKATPPKVWEPPPGIKIADQSEEGRYS